VPPETAAFTSGFAFRADGIGHPVLVAGEGPPVILLHELQGFEPAFWRLAHRLKQAGFALYVPALFADADATPTQATQPVGVFGGLLRVCIMREIHLFARHGTGPLSGWLRALTREIKARTGCARLGVVGLCLTGNFAWSLAVEPVIAASVASEPSLPVHAPASLALTAGEQQGLAARTDLPLMALRFEDDPLCRRERLDALAALVGSNRLLAHELPRATGNPRGNGFPHAVLTRDLIDCDGEPTQRALLQVIEYLRARLA
jgi:dienelactone hydrolase